jgi:uncharacterized protein
VDNPTYTAFLGWKRIASGCSLEGMLREIKRHIDGGESEAGLLIFEDQTGKQIDFDLRGSIQEILDRVAPRPTRTGPGRPRLGVTSREISLLPRHWEWLEGQPNGASATLRRLVDEGRRRDSGDSLNQAPIDATGRVMTAMAGNLPGFEEAYRALYARDRGRLEEQIKDWPPDLREYVLVSCSWNMRDRDIKTSSMLCFDV